MPCCGTCESLVLRIAARISISVGRRLLAVLYECMYQPGHEVSVRVTGIGPTKGMPVLSVARQRGSSNGQVMKASQNTSGWDGPHPPFNLSQPAASVLREDCNARSGSVRLAVEANTRQESGYVFTRSKTGWGCPSITKY
eukprot:363243-Chlamydomonas_euryale.AAC.2